MQSEKAALTQIVSGPAKVTKGSVFSIPLLLAGVVILLPLVSGGTSSIHVYVNTTIENGS